MINGLEARRKIDWWCGKIQLVVGLGVAVTGAALKAEVSDWQQKSLVAASALLMLKNNAWWIVVFGPILIAVCQGIRRKFGNPWAWEAMQRQLDELRDTIFSDEKYGFSDQHRVTLFRHRTLCMRWPPFGWLVPVARSGHLTQRRIQCFRAPDQGDSCRGLAGLAWRRPKDWVTVPPEGKTLPELTRNSSPAQRLEYANATNVDVAWVNKQLGVNRKLAGSYAALLVRVKGRPWGVLVLDSRSHDPIPKDALEKFRPYGSILTPVLERI